MSLPLTFTLAYYLQASLELTVMELPVGHHSKDRLIDLTANIRLGLKCLAITNTLPYYSTLINYIHYVFIIETANACTRNLLGHNYFYAIIS